VSSASVLIVEDESLVAEEIGLRIRQLGYDVCGVVDNAEDACSYVRAMQPDLALMDIQIKGSLSGIDLARRFRHEFDIPVVYLTAHADAATLKEATDTEPFGYLIKPFDKRVLAATLETALRRRSAETKLARTEKFLATTLTSIGDAVIATDGKYRVTFINPVAARLCGCSQAEALGKPVTDVFRVTRASGETMTDLVDVAVDAAESVNLDECALTRRDGRVLMIDQSIAPIRDAFGKSGGVVIVFRDASERNRFERRLRELNTELEDKVRRRTAQLEATNQELAAFSYSIAHDLRAPLRAIIGFATRFEESYGGDLDQEGTRLLNVVTSRALRMSSMIDDYLRLSKLSGCDLGGEPLDMTELARQAWNIVTDGMHSAPALSIGSLPPATGDASLLRQVWVNLLSNAVKFTRHTPAPLVQIAGREQAGIVEFSVQDNGVGFDPEYTGKLFRVFERLHDQREYEGNGIGLCVVQRIMHRHEGDIRIEGRVGKGVTATFTLPKVPD
jgi:two-component system, cell cycle sensor histidine kinase and response regulator CckA